VGDEDTLVDRIGEAVAGGVDMVQLREKDLPGGELLRLANSIKRAIGGRALLIINERVDVAVAAAADGVQLGEEALPPAAARRIVGPQAFIGRSVHSQEGAVRAAAEAAHFLVVGTMYATRSHSGATPAGPALVRRIARLLEQAAAPLPLIGIGGITSANLGEVMRAGAAGVAVITSILASPDPGEEARKLKRAMLDAWTPAGRGPDASGRTVPTGGSSTR
jgi:thiamine-phosphate pyrophosphorylase